MILCILNTNIVDFCITVSVLDVCAIKEEKQSLILISLSLQIVALSLGDQNNNITYFQDVLGQPCESLLETLWSA